MDLFHFPVSDQYEHFCTISLNPLIPCPCPGPVQRKYAITPGYFHTESCAVEHLCIINISKVCATDTHLPWIKSHVAISWTLKSLTLSPMVFASASNIWNLAPWRRVQIFRSKWSCSFAFILFEISL